MSEKRVPRDIDEYIAAFPPHIQFVLQNIRATLQQAIPGAQERISYQMPAFALDGIVIFFAAFKKHIGVYPPVQADEQLSRDIARYRGEKGNFKFPLDEPIPYDLIARIAQARAKEHREQAARKRGEN
jgi:uncharacterized protein YdhG (YjbR/CyaY superfamily)